MDGSMLRSQDEMVWELSATEATALPDPACPPPAMKLASALFCLGSVLTAHGHGSHGHDAPAEGETIQQYAQRHVRWMNTQTRLHPF